MRALRLDRALVQAGLASSPEKALAVIMAAEVLVNGSMVDDPGYPVKSSDLLSLKQKFPYVSRGALKIARAVEVLGLEPADRRVLDIGISSGGFSDYLLQHGAAAVTGVDVNLSLVSEKLRKDPRVTLVRGNARNLKVSDLPWPPDLVVIDVSFISVLKILQALQAFPPTEILVLVKPQFEGRRSEIGPRGVVTDLETCRRILDRVRDRVQDLGFSLRAEVAAGIRGRQGNQEFFLYLGHGKTQVNRDKMEPEVQHV